MQKPKIKLQIAILLEFWVVFTVSSLVGNPVTSHINRRHREVINREELIQ